MADELRERVAEVLALHTVACRYDDDGECVGWACACGEGGPADRDVPSRYAHHAEDGHLAAAVLAALDLDAREAVAVERGRREAAEVAALMGQYFDRTTAPGLLRDGLPSEAVAAMRATDVLAALGSDTIRAELLAWAALFGGLDPRCPEHGTGMG